VRQLGAPLCLQQLATHSGHAAMACTGIGPAHRCKTHLYIAGLASRASEGHPLCQEKSLSATFLRLRLQAEGQLRLQVGGQLREPCALDPRFAGPGRRVAANTTSGELKTKGFCFMASRCQPLGSLVRHMPKLCRNAFGKVRSKLYLPGQRSSQLATAL